MPQIDFCYAAAKTETDECILWPFARNGSGYGIVKFRNRSSLTHRVVCILYYGEPPFDGALAIHACRNRHCINPVHLKWGTRQENADDCVRDGTRLYGEQQPRAKLTNVTVTEARISVRNGSATVKELAAKYGISTTSLGFALEGKTWKVVDNAPPFKRGRVRGERAYASKLCVDKVLEIRALYARGDISQQKIAEQFGVSQVLVSCIVRRKIWAHI